MTSIVVECRLLRAVNEMSTTACYLEKTELHSGSDKHSSAYLYSLVSFFFFLKRSNSKRADGKRTNSYYWWLWLFICFYVHIPLRVWSWGYLVEVTGLCNINIYVFIRWLLIPYIIDQRRLVICHQYADNKWPFRNWIFGCTTRLTVNPRIWSF